MTIHFNCPNCEELIAFADKYRGKRGRCASCGQQFIIPSNVGKKVRKIKAPPEQVESLPGFYKAVFVDSFKLFTNSENTTGLVFIFTAVCLKFFTARLNYTLTIPGRSLVFDFPLPFGWIIRISTWGFLFWYYMELIYSTAYDTETLPELIVGGFYGLFWRILKSVYTLLIILVVVEFPFFVTALIFRLMEVEMPVLLYILMFGGLYLFPVAILTAAVGRDLTMLRPDYLLLPIFRAFGPYFVTAMLLGAAGAVQFFTGQYSGQSFFVAAGLLIFDLVVQVLALVAMRSIGLFFRHYNCMLPW